MIPRIIPVFTCIRISRCCIGSSGRSSSVCYSSPTAMVIRISLRLLTRFGLRAGSGISGIWILLNASSASSLGTGISFNSSGRICLLILSAGALTIGSPP